jgi:methionyl aminopeptidase
MSKKIIIKTPQQIENIRQAGKLLNELLVLIAREAQPWVALITLEEMAQAFMDKHSVTWAFKWFDGFPANLCLSVNDCVVHGIPDSTILATGDLLKIDSGVVYKWGIADAAVSIIVGGKKHNAPWAKLINATKQALDTGMKEIIPGRSCMPFAQAVQKKMLQHNCAVIKNLTGHGVGNEVHEAPHLYNRPHASMSALHRTPWRVVALEPITAIRSTDFKTKPHNERNIYTTKGDLGAQREYTIAIHADGIEILAGIEDESLLI